MLARIVLSLVLCGLVACGGNARAPVEDRAVQSQPSAYTVKRGDTLYSIAFRYGLDFRKVAAANRIVPPYTIYPGQKINLDEAVPPGKPSVAAAKPAAIPVRRSLPVYAPVRTPPPPPPSPIYTPSPSSLPPDSVVSEVPSPVTVTKPAVSQPIPAPAPVGAPPIASAKVAAGASAYVGGEVKSWLWPTAGTVTRGYSESVHKGIDISGARGDSIVAVAAGKVVYAGTGIVGFGELLIVKHNEVYLSAYGHNDRLLVAEGQTVAAGQTIAEKGSSGTDTVKLHFEIRKEGKPIDPQRVLPPR